MKKSGILNIRMENGVLSGRLLYEKKSKSYNADIIELLKGFDGKRISIKAVEIKESSDKK